MRLPLVFQQKMEETLWKKAGKGDWRFICHLLWQQAILLFALAIIAFFCAKITPKDSIVRLEKLLNLISTLPAETLQPENTDLSSEEAENTAGETE